MQERFCFAKKRESPFLTLTLSSFLLLLSILLVLVSVLCCVAGRYCFRLIATVVVDFSLLLFTHTHTCRSFSFLLFYCQKKNTKKNKKKNEKYFYSSYINVLILILSFIFFSSSSSYVITHPFLLLQSYLLHTFSFFFPNEKTFFYFPLHSFHTRKLECHQISKKINTHTQPNKIKLRHKHSLHEYIHACIEKKSVNNKC